MKVLILGSTGLLGQAVTREAERRDLTIVTAARAGARLPLDMADAGALTRALDDVRPDIVFNCAGLTDLKRCEDDPGLAYAINARPLSILAAWADADQRQLVHVSTDHYFPNGGATPHGETDRVQLINDYARSKYAGETFALTTDRALVLRTSIVGLRGWAQPTLAEWAIRAVLDRQPVSLFTDAFTSSIDVGRFARAAFDLVEASAHGLLNLAAAEVYSKASFVEEIAMQLGRPLDGCATASVTTQSPRRASSLGLDVTRAEALLGYRLPTLPEVVAAIVEQHRGRNAS